MSLSKGKLYYLGGLLEGPLALQIVEQIPVDSTVWSLWRTTGKNKIIPNKTKILVLFVGVCRIKNSTFDWFAPIVLCDRHFLTVDKAYLIPAEL